jgi:predicted transcriptional regulator
MFEEIELSALLDNSRGAESRKKILKSLFLNAKNCSQISKEIKLNWRTVDRHLNLLLEESLVRSRTIGSRKFYKLTPLGEGIVKNQLLHLPKTDR